MWAALASDGSGRVLDLLPRVIARAHQRPGLDVAVAHRHPEPAQLRELGGRVVNRGRQKLGGGAQIMAGRGGGDALGAAAGAPGGGAGPLLPPAPSVTP